MFFNVTMRVRRLFQPYPAPPAWGRWCTPAQTRTCDPQWKGWVADADNSDWPRQPLRRTEYRTDSDAEEDRTRTTDTLLRLAATYHG